MMNAGSHPRASVVIASLGDRPDIGSLLRIVRAQADANASEVLLVLNRPESEISPERLEMFCSLAHRVEFEPISGKSQALNTGVGGARGEVIVFTDDDTEPQPGWLESILEVLTDPERHERLVAVGGPVIPIFENEVSGWFRDTVLSRRSHYLGPRHQHGTTRSDYPFGDSRIGGVPLGANFAVRREVFDKFLFQTEIGPTSKQRLRCGEDTLFARQLLDAGLRIVYEPTAIVHHPVPIDRTSIEYIESAAFGHGQGSTLVRQFLGLPVPSLSQLVYKIVKQRCRLLMESNPIVGYEHRRRLAELRGKLDQIQRPRPEY